MKGYRKLPSYKAYFRKVLQDWHIAHPDYYKQRRENDPRVIAREVLRRKKFGPSQKARESKDPRIVSLYKIARRMRVRGIDVQVDHVVPLARGGLHVYENLQILPASENRRKGAKLVVVDSECYHF